MPDEVRRRRFPLPWAVEETDACFIVRDRGGQAPALCAPRLSLNGGHAGVTSDVENAVSFGVSRIKCKILT
jgi:hypothetical protein